MVSDLCAAPIMSVRRPISAFKDLAQMNKATAVTHMRGSSGDMWAPEDTEPQNIILFFFCRFN